MTEGTVTEQTTMIVPKPKVGGYFAMQSSDGVYWSQVYAPTPMGATQPLGLPYGFFKTKEDVAKHASEQLTAGTIIKIFWIDLS
jgi:hypothetical protein